MKGIQVGLITLMISQLTCSQKRKLQLPKKQYLGNYIFDLLILQTLNPDVYFIQ